MPRQAAEFATHRPGYWREYAARASKDLMVYADFVHEHLPYGHHEVIVERLLYGDRLELILGPPDTAKTTWAVMWAEWVLGRDPNWRWLVTSEIASGIATTIVTQMGETISSSERYHMVFGQLRDPSGKGEWSSYSIRLRTFVSPQSARRLRQTPTPPPPFPWLSPRGRRPGLAHPNVRAAGWRTGYTGIRAEGIIADDICSDKTARSVIMSKAIFETVHQKMLARLTGPDQRAVFFGQTWAPRDPYSMIREKAVPVYDNNPEREGMWVLDRDAERAA